MCILYAPFQYFYIKVANYLARPDSDLHRGKLYDFPSTQKVPRRGGGVTSGKAFISTNAS